MAEVIRVMIYGGKVKLKTILFRLNGTKMFANMTKKITPYSLGQQNMLTLPQCKFIFRFRIDIHKGTLTQICHKTILILPSRFMCSQKCINPH